MLLDVPLSIRAKAIMLLCALPAVIIGAAYLEDWTDELHAQALAASGIHEWTCTGPFHNVVYETDSLIRGRIILAYESSMPRLRFPSLFPEKQTSTFRANSHIYRLNSPPK